MGMTLALDLYDGNTPGSSVDVDIAMLLRLQGHC
jgi:hypothetical protein